jgi:serine/threonine protein kinase
MKVMEKKRIAEYYQGDDWEKLTLIERKLMANLHHPLLINLGYAFQNIKFLFMVMDISHAGDLQAFGCGGEEELTAAQVRFVAMEVCAVIVHLHNQLIMYRDLKPQNLLLDEQGHVRLIDFGVSEQADPAKGERPTSRTECGSMPYMAPEVKSAYDTREYYGVGCDWFSFGVVLYELQEKEYPFGDDPKYANMAKEYLQPELLDDDGESEVKGLFDLLAGLLDWNPDSRLGATAADELVLQEHEYWQAENGTPADWELIDQRRMPSLLMPIVNERMGISNASEKMVDADSRALAK